MKVELVLWSENITTFDDFFIFDILTFESLFDPRKKLCIWLMEGLVNTLSSYFQLRKTEKVNCEKKYNLHVKN